MMNETIATLTNTTLLQDVLNDERIQRLVLDIIEAKNQEMKSPSPASSTIDNTTFNRKPNRVVEYKKLYLQTDEEKRRSGSNNYRVITNVNNAVIEATPYKDSSMILFLTKFSSLNAFSAPTEKLKTKNRNEIAVIRNCTGKPAFAAFYDGVAVHVCHFELHDEARKEVKRVAKMLKLEREKKYYGDLSKKMRAMLIAEVPSFDSKRFKKISVYALNDYIKIINSLPKGTIASSQFSRLKKYLQELLGYMDSNQTKENENIRIASALSEMFDNVDSDEIIAAEAVGNTFHLDVAGVAGESIAMKAKKLVTSFKCVAYMEKLQHTNNVINELYDIMFETRKIKMRNGLRKLPNPITIDKETKEGVTLLTNYTGATLSDFKRLIDQNQTVPFDSPIRFEKQIRNTVPAFYQKVGDPKTYEALFPLWQLRKKIFPLIPIKNWKHFCELLLSEKCVMKWIRYLIASYSVAKINSINMKPKLNDGDPTLVGNTLDPVIEMLLEQRYLISDDLVNAHYMQILLPVMLAKWFSTRQTTCLIVNIISKTDFDKRIQIPNIPEINHVIDIIRTGTDILDYRVRISHSKKRSLKPDGKDVDIEGEELLKKKHLVELLPQIFKAYHVLTGHEVKHCNSEPRCYISGYVSPIGEKKGWRRVLKCHQFPFMFPLYEHGSKHFISPSIPVDGAEIWIKVNEDNLLDETFMKANSWTAGVASKVSKHLSSMNVEIDVDGSRSYTALKTMPLPNKPRKQACCLFYTKNTTQSVIHDSMQLLNSILKQIIDSGLHGTPIYFSEKYFGKDYQYVYKGKISEHLKLVAEHCKLEFKFLGRYGSGVLKLLSCNHIIERLRGCSRATALLKNMIADVLRQEDHDNEKVVLDSYTVFKSEKLRTFAQLHNPSFARFEVRQDYRSKKLDRFSSNPYVKPTADGLLPTTFVKPIVDPKGSLKDRCGSMSNLSIVEQSAQVRYFSFHKEIRNTMNELKKDAEINQNESFKLYYEELQREMQEAGILWGKKWKNNDRGTICNAVHLVKRAAERCCLSPKKKRKKTAASSSSL
jgi:hypothetical protein